MNQDLFTDNNGLSGIHLNIPDADIIFYPSLFTNKDADDLLMDLTKKIMWKQERIVFYGKVHDLPRLTAWYGDPNKIYIYSGIRVESLPWIEPLLKIKNKIQNVTNDKFNSVLLNLYRNESDSVAWHSDDEKELGTNPVIASVSLGEERVFQLKHIKNSSLKMNISLPHGSLLLMRGGTQNNWIHQVPKSKTKMQPRINLTFRMVN